MSLFSEFKTDPKREQEGVPFLYPGPDGKPLFRVKLARSGGRNKKYDQVRERVTEPYRRMKKLTDEVREEIALTVFAEAIIVPNTWETYDREQQKFVPGIETADGIKPATTEEIISVMSQLPDLYAVLVGESMNMSNYLDVALEQDSKN